MALIFARNRVIICLLALVTISPFTFSPSVGAQPTAIAPAITAAATRVAFPNTLVVMGAGFTPGGIVHVALYDQQGIRLQETVSSDVTFGPNGSQDPALGFDHGGAIAETFEGIDTTVYGDNGSQDPARGYNRHPRSVRVVEEIIDAVYGPNGSQDPAQGFRPGEIVRSLEYTCESAMTVRAFDQTANV